MPSSQGLPANVGVLPKADRIDLAHQAYKNANGKVSIRAASKAYGVNYSTLFDRVKGSKPRKDVDRSMQRLTVQEEDCLHDWILQMEEWGWPTKVDHLRREAEEVLKARGDLEPLGTNWIASYMKRHADLESRFVDLGPTGGQLQDTGLIDKLFGLLFKMLKQKHGVQLHDVHERNEKGVIFGSIGKSRAVVKKLEKVQVQSVLDQTQEISQNNQMVLDSQAPSQVDSAASGIQGFSQVSPGSPQGHDPSFAE